MKSWRKEVSQTWNKAIFYKKSAQWNLVMIFYKLFLTCDIKVVLIKDVLNRNLIFLNLKKIEGKIISTFGALLHVPCLACTAPLTSQFYSLAWPGLTSLYQTCLSVSVRSFHTIIRSLFNPLKWSSIRAGEVVSVRMCNRMDILWEFLGEYSQFYFRSKCCVEFLSSVLSLECTLSSYTYRPPYTVWCIIFV